ncbi:MAG: hypothetical protein H7839_05250 [Magnetococcus sp. YQC-5]
MQDQPDVQVHDARERLYVDYRIQKWLLVGLVILETILAASGVGYLYFRFKSVIEENMYRIHHVGQDVFSVFLEETGQVLVFMLVINLVGLLIADRFWVRYVRQVLGRFTGLAVKVTDLDFRPDQENPDQHAALDLMLAWRQKERSRSLAIREIVGHLEAATPEQMERELQKLRGVLPPYSRRFVGRLGVRRSEK